MVHTLLKKLTNGVTYEISNDSGILKAHHKQLKLWYNQPAYIKECLNCNMSDFSDADSQDVSLDSNDNNMRSINYSGSSDNAESDDNNLGSLFHMHSLPYTSDNSFVKCATDENTCIPWISPEMWSDLCLFEVNLRDYEIFISNCEVSEALEKSTLDWSLDQDDLETDTSPINRISTPMFVMERDVVELSRSLSPGLGKDCSRESRENLDSFLLWLEQSLLSQHDYIERVSTISRSRNDAWIEDVSDVMDMANPEPCDIRQNVLEQMSKHVGHISSCVTEFRTNRTSETWKTRLSKLYNNVQIESVDEVSDVVPIIDIEKTGVFQRTTRSRGTVPEYPNVLGKPLEYKSFLRL